MFDLTSQERRVLFVLAVIIFIGAVLEFSFKKYPELHDIVNVVDTGKLYPKIDVNAASVEELVSLPYIGQYTANQIIQYRQNHGPFTALEQLKNVKGIRDKNFEKFKDFLKITQ